MRFRTAAARKDVRARSINLRVSRTLHLDGNLTLRQHRRPSRGGGGGRRGHVAFYAHVVFVWAAVEGYGVQAVSARAFADIASAFLEVNGREIW